MLFFPNLKQRLFCDSTEVQTGLTCFSVILPHQCASNQSWPGASCKDTCVKAFDIRDIDSKQQSVIFNIHWDINRATGMRHLPLSDEGFKTELSSWIALHITSVFIALIWCPVMFLDLCISCFVFSVNTPLDSTNPPSLLLLRENVIVRSSGASLSTVCPFFPLREESWRGGSEPEPHMCWKSSVVGLI